MLSPAFESVKLTIPRRKFLKHGITGAAMAARVMAARVIRGAQVPPWHYLPGTN